MNLPSTTATCIRFKNSQLFKKSHVFKLLQINKHVEEIRVDFCDATVGAELTKVIKLITKYGINLVVERAQNPDTIIDIYSNWRDKYDAIHKKYSNNVNNNNLKRKHNDDTLLISAPKNKKQRQKFYLQKSMELLEDVEEDIQTYSSAIVFSKITNGNNAYELQNINIGHCYTPIEFNKDILSFVKKFHDSDDCATEMVLNNSKKAIAKVQRKTYLSTQFQEISIFIGFYELLVTSGYIAIDSLITPFLGTAITSHAQLNEQHTEDIYLCNNVPTVTNTARLLRQYLKHQSHMPWGFYSASAFAKGFTPVVPIAYLNHVSQKKKGITVHHFASKLLSTITTNKIIKPKTMVDLWLFMIKIPLFIKVSRANSFQTINFEELNILLQESDNHVYFRYLVGICAHIEKSVQQKSQFFGTMYSLTDAKNIALNIGKGGLFGDIKKTNEAQVKEMKRALA
ncbi:unnamed protein product [Mucor hiemalis]